MTISDLVPVMDDDVKEFATKVVTRVIIRDRSYWFPDRSYLAAPAEWQRLEADLKGKDPGKDVNRIIAGWFKTGTVWVCMEREL